MRHLGWAATLMALLVLAGCSSAASTSPTQAESQGSSSSPTKSAIADPLDGTTWRSTFTCDDMVRALDRAGLQKYRTGVIPGDCDGVMHITQAFRDGEQTTTQGGETGPPQTYELVSDHSFVVGFERVTFQIRGDHLILHPHIIRDLYPYPLNELKGEQAMDIAVNPVPFVLVS